jgi:hypothetical protein
VATSAGIADKRGDSAPTVSVAEALAALKVLRMEMADLRMLVRAAKGASDSLVAATTGERKAR